jgi:hypothetical protein
MIGVALHPGRLCAQNKGPPTEMIRGAYQEILRSWDANSVGIITKEEYVSQVRKIMK